MPERCNMISSTVRSDKSNAPKMRSRSSFSTTPSEWPKLRAPAISSLTARMWVSGSVRTPKTRKTPRTNQRTVDTMGAKMRITMLIGNDTRAAAVSALVMAYVFGKTSAKIKTNTVMINVASATPLSPNIRVNSAVVRDVARMLTKLLPNNTDPIRRSLSSVISKARCAPRDPLSACVRIFPRDAAVSAVSEPEKKPDKTKSNRIAPVVIQNALSRFINSCSI